MCGGGSAPKDRSAEIAAQQEAERKARIEGGTREIDAAFAPFDDNLYQGRTDAYDAFYFPDIDRQYKAAQDALVNRLGTSGNLTSSSGSQQLADLAKQYETIKAQYTQNGLDFAQQAKLNMADKRSQMISQLEGGGSIENAKNMAATYAAASSRAPTFSALGNLFGSAAGQVANANTGAAMGYNPVSTVSGLFNATGSKSSQATVGG